MQPEWVIATGFFDASMPSRVVRCPQWLRSTSVPRSFIFATIVAAELAQAGVAGFEAAVAHQVAPVVGQLHDAHAEVVEHVEAVEVLAVHRRVLESVDDAEAAAALGFVELRAAGDLHQHIRVRGDLAVPIARCCCIVSSKSFA